MLASLNILQHFNYNYVGERGKGAYTRLIAPLIGSLA